MASIRRTLSPANQDRPSSSSSTATLPVVNQWSNKPSNSRFSVELRRFFSRRNTWRKPFYRCLIFFIIGFLLGILHFDSINDNLVRNHDFSFPNDVNVNSFRKNDVVLVSEGKIKKTGTKNDTEEDKGSGVKFDGNSSGKNDVVLDTEKEKTVDVGLSENKEDFKKKNPRKGDIDVELSENREEFEYKNPRKDDIDVELSEKRKDFEHKNPGKDGVVVETEEEKTIDVKLSGNREELEYKNGRKLLIVVTPTYNRVLQAYYLNRLGQALRLVKSPLLWIVVEMNVQSMETAAILRNAGVMYRHLVSRKNSTNVKDRGVHQRNTGLEHIELHRLDGVVYFADDDNVYSLELFEAIRDISRFGTWPVAMLAQSKNKAILEGPVCNGSQVIGWHTNEKSKRLRRFHVDMSGFAFNSMILWDPKRWKRPFFNPVRQLDTVKEGFQETTFIEQVVAEESQMEGIPHGCGKIMNWHLHLDARGVDYPRGWILQKNR